MAKVFNLARVTTATTGTGTITLGAAVAGFLTFANAGISDGDTITYAIKDGSNSEIGRGVYTASGTTLTRASILKSTNSNNAINLSGSAEVMITPAAEDFTQPDSIQSINTGQLAGYRNKILNGCMRIWQRATASVGNDTYGFDRWNNLVQTAAVTLSQLTDVENTTPHMMRITQSQASAQRFGTSQIIESVNSKDLRGQAVTLSARVRCSASTTLRYAILEWTGIADSVTSNFVKSWTSTTFTADNFFTLTSTTVTGTGSTALTANTLATVSLTATVGSSCNNLVVIFWTDSTQAQNVTLDIGKVQLEIGSSATAFERRPYAIEFANCAPYYYAFSAAGATGGGSYAAMGIVVNSTDIYYVLPIPFVMRIVPAVSASAASDWNNGTVGGSSNGTSIALAVPMLNTVQVQLTSGAHSGISGAVGILRPVNTNARIRFDAEI